jgi:5-histidylcysteine sulfoxide synthase/putative 4-mercaptohistidine N1-methyltranferase
LETHITPIINEGNPEQKREEIRQYFLTTWELYEKLFSTLKDDSAYFMRPESLRHPLIFYFGHTATFFANKLMVSKITDLRINPKIESMLAIGVDEMSWDDLDEAHYDWPTVDEVQSYRDKVKALVLTLINELPLTLPISWDDPFWIIMMGIEHEHIHLETSSVLIRQLPLSKVTPHSDWPRCPNVGVAPENSLLKIAAGEVKQGRAQPSTTYGWDNEYGMLNTEVSDFNASKFLVSNQEFLAFVEDAGYQTERHWTEEGWNWLQYKKVSHPPFWVKLKINSTDKQTYRYRSMLEEIEMPWDWPVDVNYLEAKAFCNWLGEKQDKKIRLPTEAEWYRLGDLNLEYDEANRLQSDANIELKYWASACPVNQYSHNDFYDIAGNVWQWTETAIDGFEGFEVHPAYDDFSVPTFDGRHNLIKGGSWISTGNESTRDSRYAFRRHFIQHAGFRYIESNQSVTQEFNTYETDELISQYLEFHYGDEYFGVPNFPTACIDKIFEIVQGQKLERAFDIGCAVGRSSFELAKRFQHVDALDFSTRFIVNAQSLAEHGKVRYLITDEGELSTLKQISLKELGLAETADYVNFIQGDASNLKPIYQNYDLIFAGNLIDRLYEPAAFLNSIHERINSGGLLVLTSPYTWLEEFTKKENWIGGYKVNGENMSTLDGLHQILKENFEPFAEPVDIPFVIRETARKHQHTVAQMTFWQKR